MAKQEPALELVSAKDVTVKPVTWLWPYLIPKGKITLLQGDPGDGKSTFMLTLAAYMTRGDPLPFTDYEEPPEPIKVIYQSTEDDYDDTIIPRFLKAGGNPDNLIYINEDTQHLTFEDPRLFQAIKTLEKLRLKHPAFRDEADVWIVETWNDHVLGIGRYYEGEKLIALFNFGDSDQTAWVNEHENYIDLMTGEDRPARGVGIPAGGFAWLLTNFRKRPSR
jgi:energy-coupling factor transporter ATP-binding protein EcfA2